MAIGSVRTSFSRATPAGFEDAEIMCASDDGRSIWVKFAPDGTYTLAELDGTEVTGIQPIDCDRRRYYPMVARLWGLSSNPVAVPEIPVHANNGALQPFVDGVSFTPPRPWRALAWRFSRATPQHSAINGGSTGEVLINSVPYVPGSGQQYQENGWSDWITDENSVWDYDVTFTATGDVHVEIRVQKEV